ncbi:MAG: hypothetical protein GX416_02495 [Bacteroidales bacterium]|nr:hypothetical protein [Bacteroidales bacterium]
MWAIILLVILISAFLLIYSFFQCQQKKELACRLNKENKALEKAEKLTDAIFRTAHAYIVLIDSDFVVLKTNYYTLTDTIAALGKKRLGDLLHCRNAMCAPDGCGTGEMCGFCPIRKAIQQTLHNHTDFRDLRASLDIMEDGENAIRIDVSISGSYFPIDGNPGAVLTIYDITELTRSKAAD